MARVGGSYESVVRGVSEQAPQDRRSGQMWEQVNMISDPVRGLTRRHGSQYMNSKYLLPKAAQFNVNQAAALFQNAPYFCNGQELELLYTKENAAAQLNGLAHLHCYNKTTNRFLNIQGSGSIVDYINANGVSSAVNIGRFMFIAAKGWNGIWQVQSNGEQEGDSKAGVVWIRNGDFSRSYRMTVKMSNGQQHVLEYKTPSSAYPGTLDSSQVPVPQLNSSLTGEALQQELARFNQAMSSYNKQVADITNAYNSEVTKWVASSTAGIQPENIAHELLTRLNGITGGNVARNGSYVWWNSAAGVVSVSVDDGGDDTYMRSVVYAVDSVEKLTPQHIPGKVIKIAAKKQTNKDAYYVQAFPKSAGIAGLQEVTWKEAAGQVTVPQAFFAIAYASDSTLYIGSTPGELNAMYPDAKCPEYKRSTVGDSVSVPLPGFFGKQIDYLGVFQDRLLVGSGATIYASKPGDYFNWFRSSVLTLEDNDPVEMFALGSEDDTIYWDASFDRNHVLFGRKYQYVIPGRTLMSPKTPSIQVLSANEDAIEAKPVNSGNFVFFAKDTSKKGSLHQIQMGATSDTSESYECSQQLDKYMRGKPCQILCTTAPFNVVVRSREYPNGLYFYTYLDSMQGSERLFDSWSRWEWDENLGASMGMANWKGDVIVFTLRTGDAGTWLVADKFTFDTEISDVPYLDSWRYYMSVETDYLWWNPTTYAGKTAVAFNKFHDYYMLGSILEKADDNMPDWKAGKVHVVQGICYDSYVIPTSPYLRDQNDKAIINGRLTVASLAVAVSDTGGLNAEIVTNDRTIKSTAFDGRILTRQQNMVGRAPIVDTTIKVPVFKEIREYKLKLKAATWLPLTITGMEWLGQWFSNVRRV